MASLATARSTSGSVGTKRTPPVLSGGAWSTPSGSVTTTALARTGGRRRPEALRVDTSARPGDHRTAVTTVDSWSASGSRRSTGRSSASRAIT